MQPALQTVPLAAQERDAAHRPAAVAAQLARWRARAALTGQVRAFFDARDFVEVDTPVAIAAPAAEAFIDAVPVALGAGSVAGEHFLQTSPELAMKRLVAAGLPRIYQLAPVFRAGDLSPIHRPEFRLLEWYRAGVHYGALVADCEALLGHLIGYAERHFVLPDQALERARRRRLAALRPPYARISVADAVRTHAGLELAALGCPQDFSRALRARNIHHDASESWGEMFHRLFVGLVEPKLLAQNRPFFVTEFPLPLAALAQPVPERPHCAERFELYVAGMELANAFGELRDAAEQARRFAAENTQRRAHGKRAMPLDAAYLACLKALPPTAGIALGLDRLLLALLGGADLDDVAFIPWQPAAEPLSPPFAPPV